MRPFMGLTLVLFASLVTPSDTNCGPSSEVRLAIDALSGVRAGENTDSDADAEADTAAKAAHTRGRAWTTAAMGLAPWGVLQVLAAACTGTLCGFGCMACVTSVGGGGGGSLGVFTGVGWMAGMAGLALLPVTLGLIPAAAVVVLALLHVVRGPSTKHGLLAWTTVMAPALLSIPAAAVAVVALMMSTSCMGITGLSALGGSVTSLTPLATASAGLSGAVMGVGIWALALAQFGVTGAIHLAALHWLAGGTTAQTNADAPAQTADPGVDAEELTTDG